MEPDERAEARGIVDDRSTERLALAEETAVAGERPAPEAAEGHVERRAGDADRGTGREPGTVAPPPRDHRADGAADQADDPCLAAEHGHSEREAGQEGGRRSPVSCEHHGDGAREEREIE